MCTGTSSGFQISHQPLPLPYGLWGLPVGSAVVAGVYKNIQQQRPWQIAAPKAQVRSANAAVQQPCRSFRSNSSAETLLWFVGQGGLGLLPRRGGARPRQSQWFSNASSDESAFLLCCFAPATGNSRASACSVINAAALLPGPLPGRLREYLGSDTGRSSSALF